MTPFQQFRVWVRRAPTAERASAALAAALSLALLVWWVVPVSTGGHDTPDTLGAGGSLPSGQDLPGTSAGAPLPTPRVGATVTATTTTGGGRPVRTPAGGSAAGASGGAPVPGGTPAQGSQGCASPPGSDQGVTAHQIKLALVLVNIIGPAGNSTFGVPTPDQQRQYYQWVIDATNAKGGMACRKITPQFFTVNPADPSDQQQKCLEIAQSKPFGVIDAGGYYGVAAANCFPQHQLPFLANGQLPNEQRDQVYPYMFGAQSLDLLYRNTVFALASRGFFRQDKGFAKLGWVYRSCWSQLNSDYRGWLTQAGVATSQLVSYDVGCPSSGYSSPATLQQAILKFKQNGVTHLVTSQFVQDFANFTNIAQQQGFNPQYGLSDDGIIATSYGTNAPSYPNLANALVIAAGRFGEERSNLTPTTDTKTCNDIFKARGAPPVYQQQAGFGGIACDQIWMLKAAIDHAPSLQRNALAAGLHAARAVPQSYPYGPTDFTRPRTMTGGQFWRPGQFFTSCNCWKVTDPTFRPSFR